MNRPVTLAITGDVMLGRLVNTEILRKGFDHPWGTVLPALQKADLCLINLECAITSSTQRWHNGEYKAFYFGADPIAASTLRLASVDFASLANNHICDFGATGLNDTVATLDQEGIAHAGAGTDLTAARAPALLPTAGLKVAGVAFARLPGAGAAPTSSPGIHHTPGALHCAVFL
nr:CapA family protein [Chloroflexota bacterium]